MIRIIAGVLFLVTYLLLSYLIFPVLWVLEKVNKEKKDYLSLRIVQWGFRQILNIAGTEITVIGRKIFLMKPYFLWGTTEATLISYLYMYNVKD